MYKVTPEIIAEVRASVGEDAILRKYKDKYNFHEMIFMPLNRDTVKHIRTFMAESLDQNGALPLNEVDEMIFDACVVWPPLTQKEKDTVLPAGFMSNFSKVVQEYSGFQDVDVWGRPLRPDVYCEVIKDFDHWAPLEGDELEEFKNKSDYVLAKAIIGPWEFIIRPTTKSDAILLKDLEDPDLALCKAIVQWPTEVNWDRIPGGIIEQLLRAITKLSGWNVEARIVEI